MIELIISIIFIVWFYKTAKNLGKKPWKWAIVGFFAYFVPVFVLSYISLIILALLMNIIDSHAGHIIVRTLATAFPMVVGAISAVLICSKLLIHKTTPDKQSKIKHKNIEDTDTLKPRRTSELTNKMGRSNMNPAKIIGSIVLAVGIILCLWGGFQYLSNLSSQTGGDGFTQLMGGLVNIEKAGIRKEAGKYFIFGLVIAGVGGAVLAYGKNANSGV